MPPSYLDLELQITPTSAANDAPRYTARVLSSPVGQAKGDFAMPFNQNDLSLFGEQIALAGMMNDDPFQNGNLAQLGGSLFDALFRDELLVCLSRSLDHARRADKGLRIKLRLNEAPELLLLPWEYLYHRSLRRFLTLSVHTSLVHFIELPQATEIPAAVGPLSILVVTASPNDMAPIDVAHELANVETALADLVAHGLVTIEHLDNPKIAELQQMLRRGQYHILHFIGHGDFDEARQTGSLFLIDEAGQPDPIDGRALGILLHNEPTLRLVVLNACEGSRTAASDLFAGVAHSLVQQGVPAVIAMQNVVSDRAAITFSQELYAAVADGYPIDAALTEARVALSTRAGGGEWGTPRLLMHAADGILWQLKSTDARPRAPRRAQSDDRTSAAVTAASINRDLNVLSDFLQLPEIRATIAQFRNDFRTAREQVALLGLYKDLHDLLHSLEFLCYKGVVREARRFPDDEMALSILTDHELTLQDIVGKLQERIADSPLPAHDVAWVSSVAEAQEALATALTSLENELLTRATWLLKRVLARTPSRINERLNAAARSLRLRPIEEALGAIQSRMEDAGIEEGKIRQFEDAGRALSVLNGSLQALVDEHDRWQLLDLELRRVEAMIAFDLMELEMSWPDIKRMALALSQGVVADWATTFTQDCTRLDEALETQNPARIRLGFQRLRRQAGSRFYQIDTDLRNLCEELRQIGEPLTLMLRMLESEQTP